MKFYRSLSLLLLAILIQNTSATLKLKIVPINGKQLKAKAAPPPPPPPPPPVASAIEPEDDIATVEDSPEVDNRVDTTSARKGEISDDLDNPVEDPATNVEEITDNADSDDPNSADFDILVNEYTREILRKTMTTTLAAFKDEGVRSTLVNIVRNANQMFRDPNTEKVVAIALDNFQRLTLIPRNIKDYSKVIDIKALGFTYPTVRLSIQHGLQLLDFVLQDPLVKLAAAKLASLAYKITSTLELQSAALFILNQAKRLMQKENLAILQEMALNVDRILTGHK
ncbi:hypothetical protein M8J76_016552 [Diaphorina citri]|nr:hypothetical protein M8J75_003884 [Diaphorina citri]KAI5741727.1 hypothetical protein M8J76_016552 [Diaphorina citri]